MITYLFVLIPFLFIILYALYAYQQKQGKQKNLLFYIGLMYILIGLPFVYSFLVFFSLCSISIGIAFLFLSIKAKLNRSIQIFISILPILSFILITIYTSTSYNIFLIPKGYRGRVLIIHNCKEGEPREYEGIYRVYKINKEGLLKTKFSFAGSAFDSLNSYFYYIDDNMNREPLESFSESTDKEKITVQGLWSLQANQTGEPSIDFIVDTPIDDPYTYQQNQSEKWQKEIDSCSQK
jgi:hypothetical protein